MTRAMSRRLIRLDAMRGKQHPHRHIDIGF
jgi:hypothetical protein